MSTPNPQADLAAALPDAQPAIYETDIWNPPPDGGRLRLFKPMPGTRAATRTRDRAGDMTFPEPDTGRA